jgi:hypothetical protein
MVRLTRNPVDLDQARGNRTAGGELTRQSIATLNSLGRQARRAPAERSKAAVTGAFFIYEQQSRAALTQAKEGQNEHDHHNQPDEINDLVHGACPREHSNTMPPA